MGDRERLHVVEDMAGAVVEKYAALRQQYEERGREGDGLRRQMEEMKALLRDCEVEIRRSAERYRYVKSELQRAHATAQQREARFAVEKQELIDQLTASELAYSTERSDLLRECSKSRYWGKRTVTTQTEANRCYNRATVTDPFPGVSVGSNTTVALSKDQATGTPASAAAAVDQKDVYTMTTELVVPLSSTLFSAADYDDDIDALEQQLHHQQQQQPSFITPNGIAYMRSDGSRVLPSALSSGRSAVTFGQRLLSGAGAGSVSPAGLHESLQRSPSVVPEPDAHSPQPAPQRFSAHSSPPFKQPFSPGSASSSLQSPSSLHHHHPVPSADGRPHPGPRGGAPAPPAGWLPKRTQSQSPARFYVSPRQLQPQGAAAHYFDAQRAGSAGRAAAGGHAPERGDGGEKRGVWTTGSIIELAEGAQTGSGRRPDADRGDRYDRYRSRSLGRSAGGAGGGEAASAGNSPPMSGRRSQSDGRAAQPSAGDGVGRDHPACAQRELPDRHTSGGNWGRAALPSAGDTGRDPAELRREVPDRRAALPLSAVASTGRDPVHPQRELPDPPPDGPWGYHEECAPPDQVDAAGDWLPDASAAPWSAGRHRAASLGGGGGGEDPFAEFARKTRPAPGGYRPISAGPPRRGDGRAAPPPQDAYDGCGSARARTPSPEPADPRTEYTRCISGGSRTRGVREGSVQAYEPAAGPRLPSTAAGRAAWPIGASCVTCDGIEGTVRNRAGTGFIVVSDELGSFYAAAQDLRIRTHPNGARSLSLAASMPPASEASTHAGDPSDSHDVPPADLISEAGTLSPSASRSRSLRELYPTQLHPGHYKTVKQTRTYTPKRCTSPKMPGC
ncbi:hypothetical protein DIPPA_01111 [Diplonema papillatum]|nr:hypothetical protein DIPPA_01111 [Diplonema papillatum]